ncbi:MAG: hypothetical protein QM796_17205 [Chthoniobacteraceae bacterium]
MKHLPLLTVAALILVIVLTRLPFLDAGYGANVDAWRVANVARQLATTGEYEASRLPGYPLQEMICSLFWRGGPVALNGLSLLMSLAAVLALLVIARACQCRDAWAYALALAFTPVFFINSVSAKDYVWAIAFVLWALWAAIKNRPILCALLLGLAIGCRITSGAMMLPLGMILWQQSSAGKGTVLARFAVFACLTGALCFLPVWLRYGPGFFTFYENHDRPGLSDILQRAFVEVWGLPGLLGLIVAVAGTAFTAFRSSRNETSARPKLLAPLLVMIALYLIAFWRLPDQAGYLVPIIPAVLLLMALYTPRWAGLFLCATLIISPWLSFSGGRLQSGPILQDHAEREQTVNGVKGFLAFCQQHLDPSTIVAVGAWQPIITVLAPEDAARFPYLISLDDAKALLAQGHHLAYASESIRQFNFRANHFDLAATGAVDVHNLFLQRAFAPSAIQAQKVQTPNYQ